MGRMVRRWWAGVAAALCAAMLLLAPKVQAQCGDWEAVAEQAVAGTYVFEWDADGDGPDQSRLVSGIATPDNSSISVWDGLAWTQLRRPEDRSLRALCVYRDCLLTYNSIWHKLELIHADGSRTLLASDVLGSLDLAVAEGEDLWLGAPPNGLYIGSLHAGMNGMLHYTGSEWTTVPGSLMQNGGPGGPNRIVAWNGGLVASGYFDTVNGMPVGRVRFYDGSQWQSLSWTDTWEPRIAKAGADLIAGGHQVYRWNGVSWEVIGPGSAPTNWNTAFDGFDPHPNVASTANSVIAYSPNSFSTYVFDGGVWTLLPNWHRGIAMSWTTWRGAPVGLFSGSGGLVACAFEEGAWWHPLGNCVAPTPSAVGTWEGKVVLGGIVAVEGMDVSGIAAFDGEHWDTLGGGLPLYLRESFSALVEHEGALWVGGSFWYPTGHGTAYGSRGLWRYDGQTWQPGPGGWGSIDKIVVHNGQLYAVGVRAGAWGTQVARMESDEWDVWTTIGVANIQHMVSAGSRLYVAGNFTSIGGVATSGLAAWDGEQWSAVPPPQNLTALGSYQGALVAGVYGGFSVLGASGWQNVQAPNGYVNLTSSLTEYRGDLIVGGDGSLYRWSPAGGARSFSMDEPKFRSEAPHMVVLNGSLYIAGSVTADEWITRTPLLKWTDMPTCDCDSIDINRDGLFPDISDIGVFFDLFQGGACPANRCGDIDFNNDGLFPDTDDIAALLRVFAGGACV